MQTIVTFITIRMNSIVDHVLCMWIMYCLIYIQPSLESPLSGPTQQHIKVTYWMIQPPAHGVRKPVS